MCFIFIIFIYEMFWSVKSNTLIKQNNEFNPHIGRLAIKNKDCQKFGFIQLLNHYDGAETCTEKCGNDYLVHNIVNDDESVYIHNQKLAAGRYCLRRPKPCDKRFSKLTFGIRGWECIPKDTFVAGFVGDIDACKNQNVSDEQNNLNVIWDYKDNTHIDHNINYNWSDILNDGSRRYRCKCDGTDDYGNKLTTIPHLPFVCARNYCNQNPKGDSYFDWDTGRCICGTRTFNIDSTQNASPCSSCSWKIISNKTILGGIKCQTMYTKYPEFNKLPLCPPNDYTSTNDIGCIEHKIEFTII
jgi:Per os infectivity factor 2